MDAIKRARRNDRARLRRNDARLRLPEPALSRTRSMDGPAPDAEIAPYDHTLNTLGVVERRLWANKVLAKLLPEIADVKRVMMFAGHRYREFLVEPLERRGIKVEAPMAHLKRGEQLRWLSEH